MSKILPSELTALRTYPHSSRLWLGVQQGVDILTAEADGDHAPGAIEILLKNVEVDDLSDLIKGMTVSVGVPQAADRRVSAVFLDYDNGTLTLTIGANALEILDDTNITVYSAFKLWKLTPPAFTEQKTPPFAIMGSARAGFVDEPLAFVGEFAYSPVGRDLTDFQWKKYDASLLSGSLTAANTEDAPLVLQWDTPGEKLVRYRVTDDEGEIGKSFRPVLMFERAGANAPYAEFTVSNFRFTGGGWSADIQVFGVANSDLFPRQALIVIWAEDYYGFPVQGLQQSIGGQYRGASEIVYTGWVRANSTVVESDNNSVRFTIDSVEVMMQTLTMPDYTFRDGDDTTDWLTFADLTLDKAALHIVQQCTTLPLMADVFMAMFGFRLTILDVPSAPLLTQLQQSILQACFGYAAGSRFGSITLARHRNMLTRELRAYVGLASIMFASSDWLVLNVDGDQLAGTAQVTLEGRLGDDTPVRGVYPEVGPSSNGALKTMSGYLFFDQAQADEAAQVIWRADNRQVRGANMRLPNYRVLEPAFEEYATIILLNTENTRGMNWDNTLHGDTGREVLATGMSIEFGEGFITVSYEFTVSVYGAQGRAWDLLDPAPVLEFMYGYGQNAVTPVEPENALVDSDGNNLFDSVGDRLLDSEGA